MPSRRTVLGLAVGAAAVGVPVVGSLMTRAFAADGLPLSIVNNTGRFANKSIFMFIVGTSADGQQGFVNADGKFVLASAAPGAAGGFVDLSIPLDATGRTALSLPKMSGRIYFSIGDKLKFRVVTDGAGRAALQFPAGWVPTDPNFDVMHDCVEFTYNNLGMFCNTTMVDMFSIPLAIKLDGAKSQTTGTLTDGARDRIFKQVAAIPGHSKLVIGDNLRVLAPGHGLDSGLFSATYFDPYIDQVWKKYSSETLTVTTNSGTFSGKVTGDKLVFDKGVAPFGKPTTRDVLFCDGNLAAPNDGVTGPVAAMLGAGFNRSTLLDTAAQPVTEQSRFHKDTISNHYAAVMHANTVDGKAYGFAFDDILDFASYIQDTAPTSFEVTLTPFGSGGPKPAPSRSVGVGPIVASSAAAAAPIASATATGTPSATPSAGGSPARAARSRIDAVGFDAQSGTSTESSSEGGRNVGWIANGDWLGFAKVDFGSTAATQFSARVASGAGGGISGLIEVRLDSRSSAPVGSISVGGTGGWQSWRTISGNMARVTGVHDVYLTFASGQSADFVNINWLTFGD